MKALFLFLTLLSFLPCEVFAGKWKFRAREHYEIHSIKTNNQTYKFSGLSNTLNYWYEDPYKISYGLSLSPILGSASAKNDLSRAYFGDDITVYSVGGEIKYFFWKRLEYLFTRGGLGWSRISADNSNRSQSGWHLYGGLGWEIKFDGFSIAPEIAYRYMNLSNNTTALSFTPSVGLHFYEMF